ncbi:MAG TPA: glycosyl hydrolase family 28 protein [Verrucomicrobiae bacterium]|nr:glycosyl hydrolase family 28 protein [Verrucomicrobiae bacterium]
MPSIPSRTTNVLSFGAYGNGISNNAAAINAAITAINAAGGGTVEISPGSASLTNYLSGPITMKSKVNLQIDSGTKLQMLPLSTWEPTYGTTIFINGATLSDVEISGPGTIDGQGTNWWVKYPSSTSSRPNFIQFDHCTRVLITGVTLQNPPVFTIYLKNSDTSVTIDGITINTPYDSHNTDAFDISSTNVLIRNSYISTGDDDVEIGGSGAAATDITISNCTFGTGHGVSMGSKIGGGVNNVVVSNCWWTGTEYGIKMKSDYGSGGIVDGIRYYDLHMTNVNFPIALYMNYTAMGSPSKSITITPANAAADSAGSLTSSTPVYRNITISNLTAVGNSGIQGPGNIACIMYGKPASPVTNVTLSKVNIQGRNSGDGTFCLYHVRGIQFVDCNLTAPTSGTNTLTFYNAQFTITNSAANPNGMTMTGLGSPSNNVLSVFNGQASTRDSLFGANPQLTLASSILTVSNNLSAGGTSKWNFGLGTNTTKTVVTGNLTLGGTLNVADGGGFNTGTYTLFTYGGTLTYSGLTIGTTPNPSFTYTVSTSTAGQVNLIVAGATPPPVASFSGTPTGGTAPLPVTFTDSSTGSITNRFWNFGDGNTTNFAVSTNPGHTYNAGTYTVTLIVSGSGGSSTNIQSNYIVATNPPPPVASFNGSPTSGAAPLAVTFTDTSSGNITNRFWNFGDGNTSNATVTSVAHTYGAAGAYTVSLTVRGYGGSNGSTQSDYIVALNPAHLVVNPSSLSFGSVTIGQTNSLSFSAINTGDISLTGTATSGSPFPIINGGSYTVGAGQTQTVTVGFAPGSAGTFNGSVIFASTGGNSTNAVSGVGLTPGSIAVTPATLNFGTLATGTTAQASFVVTNSGGTTVSNGTATVTSGPFSILSGATFSVPGFGTSNVVVQFAPVSAGGFTNNVVFASANGGVATNTVIGTGAIMPAASFSASPTNGVAPLLVSFTDNSSGTITSNFWDFGDGGTTNFTAPTNVSHTYQANGTYTVTLIVTGPSGASTNMQVGLITVLSQFQAWQVRYFGSTNNPAADPNADPDGDGMNNMQEFLANTDPTNSASTLRIVSAVQTDNDVLINWTCGPGTTNALQRSSGDAGGGYSTNNFSDICTVTNSVGPTTNFLDVGVATNVPSLYYRVRLVP